MEQYAVYDETGIYVGDVQSKGAHFYSSELREAILTLGVWETETVKTEIEKLQKKLEIQDQNVAIFSDGTSVVVS